MDPTGFVQALLDDPDDVTTLLVFADWLEERGAPRGELVRVQGELARWEPDLVRRTQLQQRERELIGELAAGWVAPLGPHCQSWRIDGGLLDVTLEARHFAARPFNANPEVLAKACVRRVRLLGVPPALGSLAKARALEHVGILDLDGAGLNDVGFLRLLESPYLTRLRELDLSNNALTGEAVDAIADAPWFGQLRRLSLRNNRIDTSGLRPLLGRAGTSALAWLDVQGNPLEHEDHQALLRWQETLGLGPTWQGMPLRRFGPLGMEFRLIRPGTFLMGSPEEESERLHDEGPQHRVTLTRPFYLGAFPVTQEQYLALAGLNPSNFTATNEGGPNHPVENLPYATAAGFCRRLSELPEEKEERRRYRLSSEAEWEYACRAGDALSRAFSGRGQIHSSEVNYNGTISYRDGAPGVSVGRTTPVGRYKPNAWGLYDMHGNVWEWCQDWYDPSFYSRSSETDPRGPRSGRNRTRVVRGGAYFDPPRYCRCAIRGRIEPGAHHDGLGFRVVMEVS